MLQAHNPMAAHQGAFAEKLHAALEGAFKTIARDHEAHEEGLLKV